MKRYILLFTILTMLAFTAYALDSSMDIGVNLSYNTDSDVVNEDVHSGLMKQIAAGLEMRGNISNFQTTLAGDITVLDTQSLMFSGIFGVGLSVDLFRFFKLGVTTGPKVTYVYRDTVKSVNDDGSLQDAQSLWDALLDGSFYYRVMFDILAGPVMSFGLAYTVPTTFSMRNGSIADLIPTRDLIRQGQIAACISMKVF
ncbi:MAG: hypothetical protein IJ863_07450 [Spirochaetales bacterium]|nr:hypothetical protein [Spirochaetales bacterium]